MTFPRSSRVASVLLAVAALWPSAATGQTLEARLLKEEPAALARAARTLGDPVRGAVLFHQPQLSCTKCHTCGGKESPLGPDLAHYYDCDESSDHGDCKSCNDDGGQRLRKERGQKRVESPADGAERITKEEGRRASWQHQAAGPRDCVPLPSPGSSCPESAFPPGRCRSAGFAGASRREGLFPPVRPGRLALRRGLQR